MKLKEELLTKIDVESREFYTKILNIKNGFESINKKPNDKKNHILVSKTFYDNNEALIQKIKKFIICLWDNPKIFYKIITNSDINELKYNIFPLLINNFYENMFSSSIFGNQLIYIIIMLINEDINNLNSLNKKK